MRYDVIFIGGGPGGYVGAIKARHLGLKVALVEKDKIGGTCLLRGCIPTKTLIANCDVVRTIRLAKDFGISVDNFSIDYEKMKHRKDDVVGSLSKSVAGLVASHGVSVYSGEAQFISPTEIKVKGKEPVILESNHVVIGTGSMPAELPQCPIDRKIIHDSTSILEVTSLPKKLIVLGGGYIGCEFASLFRELGVEVTIVEFLPGIVWTQGKTISGFLTKAFTKAGIELRCNVKMEKTSLQNSQVTLHLSDESTVSGDCLLVSVGRKPYTEGLNLNAAGLTTNARGFIDVNDRMQTSVAGIYAIGDVTGKSMLAHVASHGAIIAAENIAKKPAKMDYNAVPAVIFTHPEIATVGLTLDRTKELGLEAISSIFPFAALGKAQAARETEGFAEIISDPKTGRIYGASMVGHDAGNMIASMAIAIANELTLESISETIHAHPTLSEAWLETALLAQGIPLHLPPKRGATSGK